VYKPHFIGEGISIMFQNAELYKMADRDAMNRQNKPETRIRNQKKKVRTPQ
jgi:hypothetical protein